MAYSHPLPTEDVDETRRKELEEARNCYLQGRKNNFCILCRTKRNPSDIVLNHLIPYSVLDRHPIGSGNQEVGQRLGYKGYCNECEGMLKEKGERYFDQDVHAPLTRDYTTAIDIKDDKVAGIYHCALFVWWRMSALSSLACDESDKGRAYRKLLEYVRVWLHKPRKHLPLGLQVAFIALHPDDRAHLDKLKLEKAAAGYYTSLRDDIGRTWLIPLGPLMCWYMFMKGSAVIPRSLHIDEGKARWHWSKQCLERHMANLDDEQRRLELKVARGCLLHNQSNYFCILCRKKNPEKVQLSHTIPFSVLQEAGPENHSIGPTGQEVGNRRMGYRGYCKACEKMLSENGEKNFNQLMHKPLVKDYNSAISVEGDKVTSVYHCALSIWWRMASLTELACEETVPGKNYRMLLERVRVWLHNPVRCFPVGLNVGFMAFHPDDMSHLSKLGLELAATRCYLGWVDKYSCGTIIHLGPLICKYRFEKASVPLPNSVCIDEGTARPHPRCMQDVEEHMKGVKEDMLKLEARASNQKPLSSEPPDTVSSLDIIPPRIAIIFKDRVEFPYHRFIHRISIGIDKLDLYKPKKKKDGNDPPYQAMASIPTEGGGLIRVWLQSDATGKSFEIHKDAPIWKLTKETLASTKARVASYRLP